MATNAEDQNTQRDRDRHEGQRWEGRDGATSALTLAVTTDTRHAGSVAGIEMLPGHAAIRDRSGLQLVARAPAP